MAVNTGGVLAGKTLTQISVGYEDTCALDSTGAAYCWGDAFFGQLGDGTPTASIVRVPVAVDTSGALAGKPLTQISAGFLNTCALDSAGTAYCWGHNGFGELGDNRTSNANVPTPVDAKGVLAGKTLTQISPNYDNTCALDSASAMYCWGSGVYGGLGNDRVHYQSAVPVLAGPQAPASVKAVPGDTTAHVSWTVPARLDGGTLTGYTATASPGGAACSTTGATRCTIIGLADGTTYSITVVAHTTAGDSGASAVAGITPAAGSHSPTTPPTR